MSAHVVISLDVTPDGLGRRRHSGTATLSMVKPLGVAGTGAARGRRDRVRDWSTRAPVEGSGILGVLDGS